MDTCESGEVDDSDRANFIAQAKAGDMQARALQRGLVQPDKSGIQRPYLLQRDRFICNDLSRRSGSVVFSSSRGGEFSFEDDTITNGFFSAAIVTALSGADTDSNHTLIIDELRDYVTKNVSVETKGAQKPGD